MYLQLILLPLQADVHDTAVSRAMNPLNCLTTLTSIAYLRWASKSILPQVPGAPMDVAIAQVRTPNLLHTYWVHCKLAAVANGAAPQFLGSVGVMLC